MIAIENWMAENRRFAQFQAGFLPRHVRRGQYGGGLASRFREHGKDGIQIGNRGGLIERDAQPLAAVTEVDFRRFRQRAQLDVVGMRQFQRVEKGLVGKAITEFFQFVRQRHGRQVNLGCDAFKAGSPVIHGIHAGHDCQQGLRGAYVGRGLLAADVLFAGLQRHAQRGVTVGIYRYADQPSRHRTFASIAAGKESGVRAAVAHRHTEALRGAQHDVRPPFARRGEQHQTQNVGCHGDAHALLFGARHKIRIVVYHAVGCRILQQRAIQLVVQRHGLEVADHQFDA